MPPRRRNELGQTSTEYLGMIVVVVAMVAALLSAAPDIGDQIVCEIDAQISKVGGGIGSTGCAAGGADRAASSEPTQPCVVSDSSGQLKASITVGVPKGGGEVKLLTERRSDGSVRITASGGGNFGGELTAGASAGIDVRDFTATEGASAKASVSILRGEGGGIWDFASQKEADEFVEIVQNRARDGAINTIGGLPGRVGTTLLGEDRPIPRPTIVYAQGGVGAAASGEAGAGTAYANGSIEASQAVGGRRNLDTGETTLYYASKGSGDANIGALLTGAGGQGDLDSQLAITVDRNGRATQAQIIGKGGVTASDVSQLAGVGDKRQFVSKLKGKGSDQQGLRGEVRATLDLTDPANADLMRGFFRNPVTGAADFAEAFADKATWDARVYEFDREKYGGDVKFGEGIGFGIEAGYEGVNSQLKNAYYWGPNSGGVQEWASCK